MTEHKSKTYPVQKENLYPFPRSVATALAVNEDSGDYNPKPVDDAEFPSALQAIRARAQRESAYAEIGRLLRLADLLDSPEPVERSPEALAQCGRELRESAILLEETVCALAQPLLKGRADD